MAVWEYKVATLTDNQVRNSENQLNTFGAAGWEVITIIRLEQNDNVIFARRRLK